MSVKIIDGKGSILGRLASFVAKEAIRGEEIIILNCDSVIISGSKKDIEKRFKEKRDRVGSSQKGPRHQRSSERIVKRTIRGMLPDHRRGKGRKAFNRIKCYDGIPKEFQEMKTIQIAQNGKIKSVEVKHLAKKK